MQPPLSSGAMDPSYWIMRLTGILRLIVENHTASVIYDILLFSAGILSFLFPLKRIFIIPFSILLFLFVFIYNSYILHHNETMAGVCIVLIAFWPKDNENCSLLWQGVRYFTCFVYPMSVFWKSVFGNAIYYWPQGTGSFKANLVEFMYMNPHSVSASVGRWFLQHGWMLNTGIVMVHMMELLMAIGLFTKKFDRILFWFPVFIHVSSYFFADVFYLEMLVVDISLLSMLQIAGIGKKLPLLAYGS